MFMDQHSSSVLRTCFLQLRELRHIRNFILKFAVITIANAFIHFCINYCNILFYRLPKNSLHCLPKVQSSVARIVTRISLSLHITPILKVLHWLPVKYRINFKLCCITHHVLSLGETHYLNSFLIHRLYSHSLPLTLLCYHFFNKILNGFRFFA